MENNNTNTDYHKFVRVGDQKWEIVEITIGIIFFCLRFVFTIFYTGSFQVPPKKNHPHLKCQFPPKIPIWPKSLLYEHSGNWLSPPCPPPPPHHPSNGGGGRGVQTMCYLFLPFSLFTASYASSAFFSNRFFSVLRHSTLWNFKHDKWSFLLLHKKAWLQ